MDLDLITAQRPCPTGKSQFFATGSSSSKTRQIWKWAVVHCGPNGPNRAMLISNAVMIFDHERDSTRLEKLSSISKTAGKNSTVKTSTFKTRWTKTYISVYHVTDVRTTTKTICARFSSEADIVADWKWKLLWRKTVQRVAVFSLEIWPFNKVWNQQRLSCNLFYSLFFRSFQQWCQF